MAKEHSLIVTVEENVLQGGAGSAVNEFLLQQTVNHHIINLAIPDSFIDHGNHEQQLAECGLDAAGIIAAISTADSDQLLSTTQPESGLAGSQAT